MKGAKILLKTLKDKGTKVIYGIVGREAEAILFNEIKGIDFIFTRDERSAAFMADIQGRLTGKIGVCYSTFGPGASNLATGVASAYLDRSPLLAISAQVEKELIHPSTHQCLDQVALMRPITKYSKQLTHIDDLGKEIARAIDIAERGVPGPCFLSIPLNIFQEKTKMAKSTLLENMPLSGCLREKEEFYSSNWDNSHLTKLSRLITKSRCPIFIIGSGIARENVNLILGEFLSALKIPVVTTYGGKGAVSCEHECYLGTVSKYLDYFNPGVLKEIFSDIDLVVLIGFDMAEGITPELWRHGKKKKFCAVNSILENKKSFIPVDLEINLPYADIFEHLKKNIKKEFFNLEEIGNLKNKISRIKEKTMQKKFSGHVGINPFVIVGILNSMLSKDDILISDVGLHKQIVSLYYEAKKPRTFFCSNGLGSMGFGLPAAIGAKRTFPRKRVIAVCGDAGFHLSSPELETSVRYRLPIICVVFCDNSVGLIRHYQKKGFKKFNPAITNFGRVDFVKLAQANGCRGHRVKSENNFRNILSNILDTDITTVIEIPLERQTYLW